ncbi:MAG: aspartyl/asparaginyl beta-hydroxylase domain-containing protein, partial [Halioglobus sp.]
MNDKVKKIDHALANKQNKHGLTLLREYVTGHPDDINQLYRLAVIEEEIGSKQNAAKAYLQCLKHEKKYVLVYLCAGYFFQQQGQLDKALAIYSLGNDFDGSLTSRHLDKNESYDIRLKSHAADRALRDHFTTLHISAMNTSQEKSKVAEAIWPQTHNKPFEYLEKSQRPHLFYMPNLTAMPIHDPNLFEWHAAIEKNYPVIKDECANLLELINAAGKPYLDNSYKKKGFETLAGSTNWTALHLYNNGVENTDIVKLMPRTAAILTRIPLYKLNDNPYEVFFSLLKAGQHITPHFGLSNHSLTVHLPVVVPQGGYLRVANKKSYWEEGKLVIFDDSFEHEAMNPGKEDRIVLIFSVWHPELT